MSAGVELRVERRYDPHLPSRYPAGVPLLICGACGSEGPLTSMGGVMWVVPDRGRAEDLCEACANVEPAELRKRMEAHARYLQDRAGWLLAMGSWAEIKISPELFVIGPDELAC